MSRFVVLIRCDLGGAGLSLVRSSGVHDGLPSLLFGPPSGETSLIAPFRLAGPASFVVQ